MRILTYLILAYLALGLQTGLAAYMRYQGAVPNFVLIAAIFIAINAPKEAALLGCFGMGVMHDLLTTEPLGLYAFAYSLVGMFVVSTQQLVYRSHPLTHFSMALVGGVLAGAVLLAHGLIRGPVTSPTTLLLCAIYTAVAAPFILGPLQKLRKLFAFTTTSRNRVRA